MADHPASNSIQSVLQENRVFRPPKDFTRQAHIRSLAAYRKLYQQSVSAPEKFWAAQAKKELAWFKPGYKAKYA